MQAHEPASALCGKSNRDRVAEADHNKVQDAQHHDIPLEGENTLRTCRRILSRSAAAFAAILALTAAGCATSSTGHGGDSNGFQSPTDGVTASTINWGAIIDETGPSASLSIPYLHGIETYFDATNAAGGVDGRTIKLIIRNDNYVVANDLPILESLDTQTPVLGITGLSNSTALTALKSQIAQIGVPILGSLVSTQAIISPVNPYYFSAFCSASTMAAVGSVYEVDKLGLKRPTAVAIVLAQNSGGTEWANSVQAALTKDGGKLLGTYAIDADAIDATAQAEKVALLKPNFVAIQGSAGTITLFLKAMQQLGISVPVFGNGNALTVSVYKAVPASQGSNVTMIHCFTPSGSESSSGMAAMQAAAKKYGFASDLPNDPNFVAGWVHGMLAVKAMQAAGPSPTRQKLVQALNNNFTLNTGDLSPEIRFSSTDHNAIVTARPYTFDYSTNTFEAIGNYGGY
jgi:branched-chain amino acid transport system substrate-binding protein